MLNSTFDDFIWDNIDTLQNEDARLAELDDAQLDRAVYIWLTNHETWYDDVYPASISRSVGKIATEMLFGAVPVSSRIVTNLFVAMAEDAPDSYGLDDLWWSEAAGIHINKIVNLGNFADAYRDAIYLYLEPSLEEHIFDRMAVILENDKWERYDEQ